MGSFMDDREPSPMYHRRHEVPQNPGCDSIPYSSLKLTVR